MFFFSGRAKYVHEHTCALPFLHTNHNRSLPAEQVLTPIHTIPGINAHLLYPILCPWKYSISHVCIFGCFHGNQHCVASCHYSYTWGVLQEVDIISTVRPYLKNVYYFAACQQKVGYNFGAGDNDGDNGDWVDNDGDNGDLGDNDGDNGGWGDNDGDSGDWGDNDGDNGGWGDNDGDNGGWGDNDGDNGDLGDNDGDNGGWGDNDGDNGDWGDNDGDNGDNDGDNGDWGHNDGDNGGWGENDCDNGDWGHNDGDNGDWSSDCLQTKHDAAASTMDTYNHHPERHSNKPNILQRPEDLKPEKYKSPVLCTVS